jgi:uncharacterized damage-inducible protein DinB
MNFKLDEAVEILERTPNVLASLSGLSAAWLTADEGAGTWSPIQVLDHLIEGEKSNWIPRLETILREGDGTPFPPFDRYAHLRNASEAAFEQKLSEFRALRTKNIARMKELIPTDAQLELTGRHPEFGPVKARELISAWVVHDLTHMAQILRAIAKRYKQDVGPWIAYLSILKSGR